MVKIIKRILAGLNARYKVSMEKYYIVAIENKLTASFEELIKEKAYLDFKCTGVEEFNLEESTVDEILGERSYSGGDIPTNVIDEVESVMKNQIENEMSSKARLKFYFNQKEDAQGFQESLKKDWQQNSFLKEFVNQDWNEEWRKHYQKIEIDEDFKIIPSWEINDKNERDLLIYPGMGFGTGNHETTFLCLKLFKKYVSKTQLCLDFGCGSGILGLATYLFNEKNSVDFFDIDESAIENTKQNIELNGFLERDFNLLLPKNENAILKKYDLIFANILQNVLLEKAEYLATNLLPNASLIISGLLVGQEDVVVEKLKNYNPKLKVLEMSRKNDWIAVILENGN